MRNAYIPNNPIEKIDGYLELFKDKSAGSETVRTENSLGRVLSRAVYAKLCDPVYNAAAMDGIAVSCERTVAASEKSPLVLVEHEDFEYVNTGNPVPSRFDAVIMIEDVIDLGGGKIEIVTPARSWQHVRVKGESIVAGEMILPSRRKIRAEDLAAIYAGGNTEVEVFRRPVTGVITTGDEMVSRPEEVTEGKLLESNSRLFSALISEYGGEAKLYPTVPDDPEKLKGAMLKAVDECDVVIINAGSSAGTKDYARETIASAGEVYLHGLAAKPGKPTILGVVKGKPVVGIPGYPVSAYISFGLSAGAVINMLCGNAAVTDNVSVKARLTRNVVSSLKNTEFVRVSLGKVGDALVATPLERGAAQIMSLVKADGILTVDRYSEGVAAGTEVEISLRKPLSLIEKNLVVIGSNDLVIDVIGEHVPLTSAHVGSMGGIVALQKGECHIAPIHLLDPATGTYNVQAVRKYFPNEKMVLIKGVGRTQGLMLPKGNPLGISSFEDAVKRRLRFANRQRGAGTRILTDYLLQELGEDGGKLKGYDKEFSTHLAVGTAVESGAADFGMGVGSAANTLGLDFIPVYDEEYDFLVRESSLSDERVQAFVEYVSSADFRNKLIEFGDYTSPHTGEIVKC